MNGGHSLASQGQTKSAVLNTHGTKYPGSREIKKMPSNKNVTEKKKRLQREAQPGQQMQQQSLLQPQENGQNPSNEMNFHKTSTSQGKHQTRHSSQTNRQPNGSNSQANSAQQTLQNTPLMGAVFHGPPMPTGDQYQGFQFIGPMGSNPFSFAAPGMGMGMTAQQQQILASSHIGFQMQAQPQVHFIAKQQKFYGISPERAPLIFKQSSTEKRPYTSSGHVLNKRPSKLNQNNNAIAALYLGSKTHNNGFGVQTNQRNQSQPTVEEQMNRYSHMTAQTSTQAAYQV